MRPPGTIKTAYGKEAIQQWAADWTAHCKACGIPVPQVKKTGHWEDAGYDELIVALPEEIKAELNAVECPYHGKTGHIECAVADIWEGKVVDWGVPADYAAHLHALDATLPKTWVAELEATGAASLPMYTPAEELAESLAEERRDRGPISIGGSGYSKVD